MTLRKHAFKAQKFAVDNSPTILTAVGVVGIVGTAYLTGKASFKSARIIEDYEKKSNGLWIKSSSKERIKLVWPQYLPAVGAGSLSVAAVIGANRIGVSRAAALAGAYAVSERAFRDYREKVIEKLGEKKDQAIRDEVAQDRVSNSPVGNQPVILAGAGDVLCYDLYTGRYFTSSMEEIKKAQNDLNYRILHHMYASLNDFYNLIGISTTKTGEEVGWNSDKLMEIQFSTIMSDDDRPCIAIDFDVHPMRNYFRTH